MNVRCEKWQWLYRNVSLIKVAPAAWKLRYFHKIWSVSFVYSVFPCYGKAFYYINWSSLLGFAPLRKTMITLRAWHPQPAADMSRRPIWHHE